MYDCQQCGMPLDDTDSKCWICSHVTDFEQDIEYYYLPCDEKPNIQTVIEFPDERADQTAKKEK